MNERTKEQQAEKTGGKTLREDLEGKRRRVYETIRTVRELQCEIYEDQRNGKMSSLAADQVRDQLSYAREHLERANGALSIELQDWDWDLGEQHR